VTPRFEDVAVGTEIPVLAKVVTRKDVEAYAEASGDQNPLHRDDEFAKEVGFPESIAHGMFTMAHLASCLVDWLGDPAALKRLRVQFRTPVFLGEAIVAHAAVRSLDPQTRRAALDVSVTVDREGVTEYAIRRGEAVVQLG
jgi:acyl dehydratase